MPDRNPKQKLPAGFRNLTLFLMTYARIVESWARASTFLPTGVSAALRDALAMLSSRAPKRMGRPRNIRAS